MNTDGKIDEKSNDNNNNDNDSNNSNGGKSLNDGEFYDSRDNNNNTVFNRFVNEARYRGRNNDQSSQYNHDEWMFDNELRFRLNRLRRLHPNYIDRNMVNTFSSPDYNGPSFECDTTFQNDNLTPSSINNNVGNNVCNNVGNNVGNNNDLSSLLSIARTFSGGSSKGGAGDGGFF